MTQMSVYDELIKMDELYNKGVAVLAAELGRKTFSSLAWKYWAKLPYIKGSWHAVAQLKTEEEKIAYCEQKRREVYERPEIQ